MLTRLTSTRLTQVFPGLVIAGLMVSVPMASAQARNEDQPRMEQALSHLRQAEQDLKTASNDKGGHRVQAVQLIQQATREVEAGIAFDNTHSSGRSPDVRITAGPTIEYVDDDSAVIAWSTNIQGSSRVEYGTAPRNLNKIAEAPWGASGLTHRVDVRQLQADTTYYFEVETGQARGSGTEVESRHILSFHTVPHGGAARHNLEPR